MSSAANTNQDTQTFSKQIAGGSEVELALQDCRTGYKHRLNSLKEEVVLGGSDSCDIVVQDPYASAIHCSLQRSGLTGWLLRDHSKNGTRINGVRVRVAELRPGSKFSIGGHCFEMTVAGEVKKKAKARILGTNPIFVNAVEKAMRAARSNCSILILGETGTGKDLVARAIHEESRRALAPFVAINCGTFPAELIRSELFGHVKGAFTGAASDQEGLFRQANRGTIFLDEIGELPKEQQPHLLRALESGLIRPVGGRLEELVNVRVVAATNRSCLSKRKSPLRLDLFHRLSTVVVEIPPLRQRRDDIPLMVRAFLKAGASEFGYRRVSGDVLEQLTRHDWAGNVRELHNSVNRALALGNADLEVADFLPKGISRQLRDGPEPVSLYETPQLSHFEENQRQLLKDAYRQHGNIRSAAEQIGIPKSTFSDLCKKYRINTKKKRRS